MLIFYHIPKTGGSSMIKKFNREYDDVFELDGSSSNYNNINFNHEYDIIIGHKLLNIDRKFSKGINIEYISFFREPIDHFLSTFYYIKRNPHNRYYNIIKNLTLEEFLNSNIKIQDFDNYQVRMLSGTYVQNVIYDNYDFKKNGDYYLKTALMNLNRIDNILLYEDFFNSLLYLKEKYGLSNNFIMDDYENKTNNRVRVDELDTNIINKIRKMVSYDISFYGEVKKKTSC